MAKFKTRYSTRSNMVVVDAVQLVEGNEEAILAFMEQTHCPFELIGKLKVAIHVPEGPLIVDEGEWIIIGNSRDFYSLSQEEFDSMYQPLTSDSKKD